MITEYMFSNLYAASNLHGTFKYYHVVKLSDHIHSLTQSFHIYSTKTSRALRNITLIISWHCVRIRGHCVCIGDLHG